MFRKGVAREEIVAFLQNKIRLVGPARRLTIVDGYFFSSGGFGDTHEVIRDLLVPFTDEIQTLEIVTSKGSRNFNKEVFNKVKKNLGPALELRVIRVETFHDRFWIVNERKAFVVGTSANSLGNKHFFVQDDYLSDKDTKDILSIYREEGRELRV